MIQILWMLYLAFCLWVTINCVVHNLALLVGKSKPGSLGASAVKDLTVALVWAFWIIYH